MSEEKPVSEEKPLESNVGASLVSALFETVDTEKKQEEVVEKPDYLEVHGISAALDNLDVEKEPEQVEEQQEPAEEPAEQIDEDKLEALDKSLFEEVKTGSKEQATEQPVQEVVQEPVQEVVQEDLNWLTPEQQKRLDLVDFASQNFEEFRGKKEEYIEFFKAQKEYIESRIAEDPNVVLDDTDHDYQAFLNRKKPQFTQDDLEKVVEFRTRKLAKEEAMSELKPELEALKEEQRKQKIEPTVSKLKSQTMEDIKMMIPEPIRQVIETEGPQAAYDKNPVEYEIINKVVTSHQKVMFAFHEISNGLTSYDSANKDHVRLANFLDQLDASMPDKDGKKFINIGQYNELSPADKKKHYTLSVDEIINKANKSAERFINYELNEFEEKLRKSGYAKSQGFVRQEFPSTPKTVKPTPRQGPAVAGQTENSQAKNPVLSALGL